MIEQMTPREALRLAGKHDWWVRKQMGIRTKSTFSRLVSGQRPGGWTPERRRAFAFALGLPEDAISFATDVHRKGTESSRDGARWALSAPGRPRERDLDVRGYSPARARAGRAQGRGKRGRAAMAASESRADARLDITDPYLRRFMRAVRQLKATQEQEVSDGGRSGLGGDGATDGRGSAGVARGGKAGVARRSTNRSSEEAA